MNSKRFEDDNDVMWTATIKSGISEGGYGKGSWDPTKPHLLVFTSDKGVFTKPVGPEKSSISNFSDEELKTILKDLQQSKPREES